MRISTSYLLLTSIPTSKSLPDSKDELDKFPLKLFAHLIIMPLGLLQLILFFFLVTVYSSPLPIASDAQLSDLGASDALDSLLKRATSKVTTRIKSTTDTQSVNWIEDVSTVDSSLNIALALPIPTGPALAFAQDEPENVKLLKATPGIDAVGTSAGTTLKKVFGGVLDQLGSIVSQPLNLPVAVNAVARIIVNRLVVRALQFEICRWNCMNLRGSDARMCFQLQRRCGSLRRSR